MSKAVEEPLADGRPPPRAKYLAGLAEHEWPGRPSPEETAAAQRERLLAAATAVFAERGFYGAAISQIVERANVSPHTFYEFFEGKQDCFRIAFDAAAAQLLERVEAAAQEGEGLCGRLRLALGELLSFLGSEPDAARLLVIGSRAAPAAELVRRDEAFGELARRLATQVGLGVGELRPSLVVFSLGAMEALLDARLRGGATGSREGLLASLMYHAMLPCLGHEGAMRELDGA